MRLLVDACVAGSVVQALCRASFDVESVLKWGRDPGDRAILRRAYEAGQILITRDKDFGELIFRDNEPHSGLLRLAGKMTYTEQADAALRALSVHAVDLNACSVGTVGGERMRVSSAWRSTNL